MDSLLKFLSEKKDFHQTWIECLKRENKEYFVLYTAEMKHQDLHQCQMRSEIVIGGSEKNELRIEVQRCFVGPGNEVFYSGA